MDTLKTIKLYGHLGERFGRVHRLAVSTPAEAVRALCSQLAGFREALTQGGVVYQLRLGGTQVEDAREALHMVTARSFAIVPVLSAAKDGLGQLLLGGALIALAVWNPMGWAAIGSAGAFGLQALMGAGISMTLGGAMQMLSPTPKAPGPSEAPENRPSYIYNGAFNTSQQGVALPVIFGKMRVGSIVVGVGSYAERIPA